MSACFTCGHDQGSHARGRAYCCAAAGFGPMQVTGRCGCKAFVARTEPSAEPEVGLPRPRQQQTPCGECHLHSGETCDICGASEPEAAGDSGSPETLVVSRLSHPTDVGDVVARFIARTGAEYAIVRTVDDDVARDNRIAALEAERNALRARIDAAFQTLQYTWGVDPYLCIDVARQALNSATESV